MKPRLILSTVLLCCGFTIVCFGQSQPHSLADVAKQDKTAKKKEVIRLTDDNLPFARNQGRPQSEAAQHDPASANTAGSVSNDGLSASRYKADGSKASASTAEKAGSKKLEEELESYRKQEQTWSSSVSDYEQKLATETSEFRRNTYREAMENDLKNVEYFQQRITTVENQLDKARKQENKQSGDDHDRSDPSGAQP